MNTIVTTETLARRSVVVKRKPADGDRKQALSEALCPSSAGARGPAHVRYAECDYDDELRYVVVLGED